MTKPAEQGHTKEPWNVDDFGLHVFSERKLVAGCGGHQDNFTPELPAINAANARRIVACVNACTGIPTDRLEKTAALGGIKHVLERAGDNTLERDRLLEQRDQLVEALKHARSSMRTFAPRLFEGDVEDIDLLLSAIQSQEKDRG